jgi:hypothetical protein
MAAQPEPIGVTDIAFRRRRSDLHQLAPDARPLRSHTPIPNSARRSQISATGDAAISPTGADIPTLRALAFASFPHFPHRGQARAVVVPWCQDFSIVERRHSSAALLVLDDYARIAATQPNAAEMKPPRFLGDPSRATRLLRERAQRVLDMNQ